MARRCSVCDAPAVAQINVALASGESCASVARKHSLSPDATERHKRHLVASRSPDTPPKTDSDLWLRRLEDLFKQAVASGDVTAAMRATQESLRELRTREERRSRTVGQSLTNANRAGAIPAASAEFFDDIMRRASAEDEMLRQQGKICGECGRVWAEKPVGVNKDDNTVTANV